MKTCEVWIVPHRKHKHEQEHEHSSMSTSTRWPGNQCEPSGERHAKPVGNFCRHVGLHAPGWLYVLGNVSQWLLASFRDFEPPEHGPRASSRAHTWVGVYGRVPCVSRIREHEKRPAAGREKNADVQYIYVHSNTGIIYATFPFEVCVT